MNNACLYQPILQAQCQERMRWRDRERDRWTGKMREIPGLIKMSTVHQQCETLKLKKLSEGEVSSLAYLIKGLLYSLNVFRLLSEVTNCRPKPFRAIRSSRKETESLNTCYNSLLPLHQTILLFFLLLLSSTAIKVILLMLNAKMVSYDMSCLECS